jgi:hypothetical protein
MCHELGGGGGGGGIVVVVAPQKIVWWRRLISLAALDPFGITRLTEPEEK